MSARRRLRTRILLVISGLSLLTSLVFSLYTVAFTYAIEDALFEAQLREEGERLQSARDLTGAWPPPRDARMVLHRSTTTLPPALRQLLSEEPARIEFPGPGASHYHLRALRAADGEQAWLLYDVGAHLVVRPIRAQLFALLAGTTLALLALALLAGYWASRQTTLKLEQLAAAVARFDPAGPASPWPHAQAADEVGTVAAGLDAMTQRLQAFVERERSFTRDASHELRTPLAVIRSAGDQLASQPELTPRVRQHATLIRDSTARLERIVEMLLAMAREESVQGADALTVLLPLIEQIIVDQAPRLDGKAVRVEVSVPPAVQIKLPPVAAQVILANLIGNAFAHTSAGTVRIATEDGWLRISNTTAGDRQSFFGDVAAPRASAADGFGFGLEITRRLCGKFGLRLDLRVEPGRVVAALPLAV